MVKEGEKIMSRAFEIVSNTGLTYQQMMLQLAQLGESMDDTIVYDPAYLKAKEEGLLCDLNEGVMPFRPRYIIVDFEKFMKQGSEFLSLNIPTTLLEATTNLMILYHHIPSITSYPVYLGNLDILLDSFVKEGNEEQDKAILRQFLLSIDRTLTDSFVHANIGPLETIVGRYIVELTMEMNLAVPNLTLKYDPATTSMKFATLCAESMLKCAKPSFANHAMFTKEWGDYAIASCYNGLKIGGGGYTLPRLRLASIAHKAHNINEFLEVVLPYYTDLQLQFMDQRISFMVEASAFFKSNFLVQEGLLEQTKFTGMFGLVGVAECCNFLLNIEDPKKGYGYNEEANLLGERILESLTKQVYEHKALYCETTNNHYELHAQVGIDSDGLDNSPGCRIPVGAEPEIFDQMLHSSRVHHFFPTGAGDIFRFEETWLNNLEGLIDLIQGAHASGMRFVSGYLANSDVVRVTGYLVKRSELAKLDEGKQSINQASVFGQGARDNQQSLERRVHDRND